MKKLILKGIVSAAKKLDKKVVDALTRRANKKTGVAGTTAKRSAAARKANKAKQAQVRKASKLFPKNPQARARAVKEAKVKAKDSAARLKRREAARKVGLANQRAAKKTAKKIYKGTAAGTGVTAVGGGAALASKNKPAPKPAPKPKPKPKPAPKGKKFNVANLRSAYNQAVAANKAPTKKAPIKKAPTNKAPAKKKLAKATTVKGAAQRSQDMLGRKFDKMTTGQISRLRGKSLQAYNKYKKGKK
tara:strand:+ start:3237 stop:3974 length:738 start_codon:yes stop_codon:yes gene_type:complete